MTRVIVADDDRVSSHLLCAVLRRNGYAPEAVMDVSALFEASHRMPTPTAILLDLNMPGGTGADSIRRLKSAPELADVPIIVVSGSDDPADQAESLGLGASAFVSKPVDPARLIGVIQRAVDAAGGRGTREA